MQIYLNRRIVEDVLTIYDRYINKSVIITIDSSKTNSAICVMNSAYKILDVIEFNGKDDKDVLQLCKEQRKHVRNIFNGVKNINGAIEDIITKKEEEAGGKFSEGLKYHHARYVITAVFISFISVFQDSFNVTLDLISNQTWKAVVLPKELNKRNVYKGSVDYIRIKYPMYLIGEKDDDVSDAICIGEYLKIRNGLDKDYLLEEIPDEEEFIKNPCKYRLLPKDISIAKNKLVNFLYNDSLTLDMNARSIANRIEIGKMGCALVDIENLSIQDIYQFCFKEFGEQTKQLKLVVKRLEKSEV